MQNKSILFLFPIIIFVVIGCSNKVERRSIDLSEYSVDYADLLEKYSELHLTTCAATLEAGEEIAKVFFATADQAFNNGDAKALSDIEHFDNLFKIYQHAADSLYADCPEDFDKWEQRNRQKIDAIMFKIRQTSNDKNVSDTLIWNEDIYSEIEIVNQQVEQLILDIQTITDSDTTNNTSNA